MSRKICVVTGSRAEFGQLYWLIKAIEDDRDLILQLVVTGMHLSPEFGLTYKDIEAKGLRIDSKVEILLSSDTAIGISKSIGLAQISFSEVFENLKPDILLVLGDRFEIFAAAISAMISKIPIAHIHGGETTLGVIDESIRHGLTKLSHLHFTANKKYRQRVIQLGEHPDRVYNFGAPGLDYIAKMPLLDRKEFEKSINFDLGEKNALVTFHPVTLENNTSKEQFEALLNVIDRIDNLKVIFTKPNSDTDGRVIGEMIDQFAKENLESTCVFVSLGQLRYLSALKFVDVIVGNSSSGLTEAPSFKIATINIGDRQMGRVKSKSVIDCEPNEKSIMKAFEKAFSNDFKKELESVSNPYGEEGASDRIKNILKTVELRNIIKKQFFDVEYQAIENNASN